jgi:hypothetical protein
VGSNPTPAAFFSTMPVRGPRFVSKPVRRGDWLAQDAELREAAADRGRREGNGRARSMGLRVAAFVTGPSAGRAGRKGRRMHWGPGTEERGMERGVANKKRGPRAEVRIRGSGAADFELRRTSTFDSCLLTAYARNSWSRAAMRRDPRRRSCTRLNMPAGSIPTSSAGTAQPRQGTGSPHARRDLPHGSCCTHTDEASRGCRRR